MKEQAVAILHYSSPPVIGGVEAVIKAHLKELIRAGYSVSVIAGRGDLSALPPQSNFIKFPEMDSEHPEILAINRELEAGRVPGNFESLAAQLTARLEAVLPGFDHLIIHNVFTKHFNLPLTVALHRLLDQGKVKHAIAWCHDFSWTSPSSRSRVHPGYPWDLLRTRRSDCVYVTVSEERRKTLAGLLGCPLTEIQLVYNGVDPAQTLGLSEETLALVDQLGLLGSDLNILMPVRITQAKNIEFALQVVSALKGMGLKVRLIVTGPPDPHDPRSMDYYQSLRDLRTELGVTAEMRFIFESGPNPEEPYFIDERVVGEFYRLSDVMFMPSHREGFGMPVMEAGLAGIPILSHPVPAAEELAGEEASIFSADVDAAALAARLVRSLEDSPTARLRRRARQGYTWRAIFEGSIQPLLEAGG